MKFKVNIFEITQEIAESLYKECNEKYFDYMLDFIPIILENDPSINGEFKFGINKRNGKIKNPYIIISTARKRTMDQYISTMIHEMIHYKIISEMPVSKIKEAIAFEKAKNFDEMNKLLYLNEYAHTGEWSNYANYINNTYGIKLNRT